MLRRILFASALAVAGLGLAAPAGAPAATTLGQTFPPMSDLSCGGLNNEVVQVHRASGISYAAPSPGVLTSWAFEASTLDSTTLTLRVYRPGAPQNFTVINEAGAPQPIAQSSGLHSFPTQIPVAAGDLIGVLTTDGPCETNTLNGGDVYDGHMGGAMPIPIGTSALFSEGSGNIVDISAKLEPDCDNDGLGDDTQDSNVTAACPTPSGPGTGGGTTGQPTTKKKCKKHKKKHKRSAESAKKKKCKKKKKKR
jgi:hypothetical protein